jgi:hypothetical protein
LFIANFDRCYGLLSQPKVYNIPVFLVDSTYSDTIYEKTPSGVCFSPNGRFAYVIMATNILQLDLWQTDSALAWYKVSGMDTDIFNFNLYNNAQLGPNNKIYIGNWNGFSNAFNVIDNPDVKGIGCDFCRRCLRFPWLSATSPPNIINFNLGALEHPCWPLDTGTIVKDTNILQVVTAQNMLYIKQFAANAKQVNIYNTAGQLVYTQPISSPISFSINTTGWATGVYVVAIGTESVKVKVE